MLHNHTAVCCSFLYIYSHSTKVTKHCVLQALVNQPGLCLYGHLILLCSCLFTVVSFGPILENSSAWLVKSQTLMGSKKTNSIKHVLMNAYSCMRFRMDDEEHIMCDEDENLTDDQTDRDSNENEWGRLVQTTTTTMDKSQKDIKNVQRKIYKVVWDQLFPAFAFCTSWFLLHFSLLSVPPGCLQIMNEVVNSRDGHMKFMFLGFSSAVHLPTDQWVGNFRFEILSH